MPKKDYYIILGVARDATHGEIKAAYRKLVMRHHPDTNLEDPGAEERIKSINEAYEVLGDKKKREQYDRVREFGFQNPPFRHSPLNPYMEEAFFFTGFRCRGGGFGRGFGGRRQGLRGNGTRPAGFKPSRSEQRIQDLPLTALEARAGAERDIRLHTGAQTRTFTIAIPPGTQNGTLLNFTCLLEQGQTLDLLFRVRILE